MELQLLLSMHCRSQSVNPFSGIEVQGKTLGNGESVKVRDGERIVINDFAFLARSTGKKSLWHLRSYFRSPCVGRYLLVYFL